MVVRLQLVLEWVVLNCGSFVKNGAVVGASARCGEIPHKRQSSKYVGC